MTPAEILERAADVIDKRGHCKHEYLADDGRVCALGAIHVVEGFHPDHDHLTTAPELALLRAVGNIPIWNDAKERTAAEVTSTMRAVAATLRAQSAVTPETMTA